MQAILRDHLESGIAWHPGPTPAEERFFTLCAHSEPVHWTTASLVAPLPEDRSAPWPVWISFGTPCTGIFLPVYLDGVIPASLARGGEHPTPDSAWWVMKSLQDAASVDPVRHTPVLREGWVDLEERIEAERLAAEAAARRAVAAGDRDRAAELMSEFMETTVEEALKRAELLRARIA
jgi:secernin